MSFAYTMFGISHPEVLLESNQWDLWRHTFKGGQRYLDTYLKKWSDRESNDEFRDRKNCTPIPSFAKAAILDIRNSIFQRLSDISRTGGTDTYQKASLGENGGVDRKGSSMNSFIGVDVLTELLIMGRVGVYVDAPASAPTTLAQTVRNPYVYVYRVEDIITWDLADKEDPGQFKMVLLKDNVMSFNHEFGVPMPSGRTTRFRQVWKDELTGKVHVKMLDSDKNTIRMAGSLPDGSVMLDIDVVPFTMPTIGDSLLTDVASYQKALLNLASADVMYAIRTNAPFLTIQTDGRTNGRHLKTAQQTGGPEPGAQQAQKPTEEIGTGKGYYYGKDMKAPEYIAPPTDPLEASMRLQEKLEDDIRKLVNLAVSNKAGSRTESAEAKKLSSQGLEAGLSYIGLVLAQAEKRISEHWARYENHRNPQIPIISYPNRYILKTDTERMEEAENLLDLGDRIPGKQMKKHIYTAVAEVLLTGHHSADDISAAVKDIQDAGYTTTDLDFILKSQESGLVSDKLASEALGFRAGEVEKAKADRVERALAILKAQTSIANVDDSGVDNAQSRGVPALETGSESAKQEQKQGREESKLKRSLE